MSRSLLERRRRILARLPPLEEILRGSVVVRSLRCGKPSCHCAEGEGHRATYLTVTLQGGRTEQISLPEALVPVATRGVAQYHAWWAVIDEVFRLEQRGKVPMRLVLEMRIMGGSGVTMAPQYGNTLGTCSIEVLTWVNTDPGEWAAFMQTITDAWARLTNASGRPLNLRPHWAKAWQGLKVRGMPIIDYLRTEAYADRFPEFKRGLGAVAQAGGTTIKDMQRLFSNSLLDQVFSDVFA